MATILLVDDDSDFRDSVQILVSNLGHECLTAGDLQEAKAMLHEAELDVVLLDVFLPNGNGLDEISTFQRASGAPQVIIVTGQGDPDGAEMAIESGAWDYLEKPLTIPTLSRVLDRALRYRSYQAATTRQKILRDGIIGSSRKLSACINALGRAAGGKNNILLAGETGTGKELFARAIHRNSPRADRSFIVVDCTSLPENLAESLLLGHVKGTFTGAYEARSGLIKQADRGTLFLDEIGELPLSVQKIFLRVLQERRFRPLGSQYEQRSDFRLVAATNRDIGEMIEAGSFRQDLYYRLCTVKIELPALRERCEDIHLMAPHFVAQACAESHLQAKEISSDFLDCLERYHWPGNVRELINAIYASVDNALEEPRLYPEHLPVEIRSQVVKRTVQAESRAGAETPQSFRPPFAARGDRAQLFPAFKEARRDAVSHMEAAYLQKLVEKSGGDVKQACTLSGLSRARLYELLKKHGISLKPGNGA
jgi:two-component system NtrC family response regulator